MSNHGKMKIVLDNGAYMPIRGHEWDGGLDLRTPERVAVRAHDETHIDFKVHVQIPEGYVGVLASKSGLNFKAQLDTPGGIIDSGFTGSIKAVIENRGAIAYTFQPGDKVCQLLILPCLTPELEVVDKLEETERGDSGWGSTGK